MTIYYLMVKTHKITGLKYLCQTKRKDPYKYLGSGKYWRPHLNKHGKTISTVIIRECQSKKELSEWGIHYSNLWHVVESEEWANLKIEDGTGGAMPPDIVRNIMDTKSKRNTGANNPDVIAKQLATKKLNGTLNPTTPDSIQQGITTKRSLNHHLQTPESIAKCLATKIINGTLNITTPEVIAKQLATKKLNGTWSSSTPDSVRRGILTRQENGTMSPNKISISCIHCHTAVGKPTFGRYHGDNCKFKPLGG